MTFTLIRLQSHCRFCTAAALALGFVATACDSSLAPTSPHVLSAVIRPAGPLARTLELTLDLADRVTIEYWTDGGPRLRLESTGEATSHSLLLARLRPSRTYQYRVLGSGQRGEFHTDSLPADLAAVAFAAAGATSLPLVLVHLFDPAGFKGYAIVDSDGEVVWYFRTLDLPFGATRRANGNFVFMDRARGLLEVTPGGEVVRVLAQDTAAREQHHDVIATPQNTLLFIAFDRREYLGAPLEGEAIWEWSPETGTATRRWTSWDFFSPAEDRGPRFGLEWMHANALAIGPRGNTLLSVHYFNQVVSIAPDWRTLEWRLGGVNASIALPLEEQFSGQHTPREIAPGRVLMFDNRTDTRGPGSRAVELELIGNRAEKRWEWAPVPPNFASAVGSARRLASGNTLVAFGMSAGFVGSTGPTEVFEVTITGQVTWRLSLATQVMYRAEPTITIAGEHEVK